MEELLTAIYARFVAAAGATARATLVGGMTLGTSPDPTDAQIKAGTAWPCASYFVLPAAEEDTNTTIQALPVVQFTAYMDKTTALKAIRGAELLRALYANQILTLTNSWTMVKAQVSRFVTPLEDFEDRSWSASFDIEYRIGK